MSSRAKTYIAIVNWEDPTTHVAWKSNKKALAAKATSVVSVGVLLSEDDDYVRIAMDWANDSSYSGVGVIPRRVITKMRKILLPPGSVVI